MTFQKGDSLTCYHTHTYLIGRLDRIVTTGHHGSRIADVGRHIACFAGLWPVAFPHGFRIASVNGTLHGCHLVHA